MTELHIREDIKDKSGWGTIKMLSAAFDGLQSPYKIRITKEYDFDSCHASPEGQSEDPEKDKRFRITLRGMSIKELFKLLDEPNEDNSTYVKFKEKKLKNGKVLFVVERTFKNYASDILPQIKYVDGMLRNRAKALGLKRRFISE